MENKFTVTELRFGVDALEPIISRETVNLHYGKHLMAYLDNLNRLVDGSGFEKSTLADIIMSASGALYNNGAQVWNHLFYFSTLSPTAQSRPVGSLLRSIEYFFGSFEQFKAEFESQALSLFGSGWVWLSKSSNDELIISQESNAGNPLRDGLTPLLTFDVWEHAYYVDYQNRRAEHVSLLWDLIDWKVVEERYLRG